MSDAEPVLALSTDHRGVATLRLNRPEKHNAFSPELIDALASSAQSLADDNAVRVVVLTGAGPSFSAGADLGWMKTQMAATRHQRITEARRLAGMLKALNELPKPLIARVNGQAFGGGLGLISIADVAIAVDSARFAFTETRLGLTPATISPYVLARMGEGRARRVFMSSRRFDAHEARELGLIATVVPGTGLDAAVEREVDPYLSCSPQAVAASKRLARRRGPIIDEAILAETAEHLADVWETDDARDGVAAFFDKKAPRWA
ncbi:MAG: crotonase/enoyl-CoA hydratase family protein [Rhodobacteraceae bacterium]|nr:crotonase/enoyl-CoA hydratase family protein [Paracoccaceae bacterium]